MPLITKSIIILIVGGLLTPLLQGAVGAADLTPGQQQVFTFYKQIHVGAQPICAQGATGLTAITNCIIYVINKLKPLAAVLLVIAITVSGAYLVFSPLSPGGVETAKTIFISACIGFVIVFSADLIRGIIHELAGR